ncbi:MAG TPA: hypothetical protein VGM23_04440, partial [Armatimonadota bacterium]|jgi:predicted dehydrogenase
LFIGREPRRVFGMGSTRMNASITVQYDDGSLATITMSGTGTLDYPKELFEIAYQGAIIVVDHEMEVRVRGIEGEPFRRNYPSPDSRVKTKKEGIEGFYESCQQTIDERLRTGDHEIFIGQPNKGHYEHMDQFAMCVRGLAESPCDALEGAKATVVSLKAIESIRLGLPVSIGNEEYNILAL